MGDNNGRPQHSRHRGVSGMNASHTKVMGNMGMNLEDVSILVISISSVCNIINIGYNFSLDPRTREMNQIPI